MVPVEIKDEVISDNEPTITGWGREHAKTYKSVSSMHPRQNNREYEPVLIEAVKLDDDDHAIVDMEDLVAPGLSVA
jgi:hypothetical protein